MPRMRVALLTTLAMIAFAGNSLFCRLALQEKAIDAVSFTSIRIIAGALALWVILRLRGGSSKVAGSWPSALALFAYAAAFSFAYITLPAGTGALLLFSAVNGTMIGYGLWTGERLRASQIAGLVLAFAGLVGLLLPGLAAPPLFGAALMLGAGVAWGIYSLRGKGGGDPTAATAGTFMRAVPFAMVLLIAATSPVSIERAGFLYAVRSGALTSAVGYAIWYAAVRSLAASSAATVQLSVPVIAAVAGGMFLGEAITLRLVIASVAILGGIALNLLVRQKAA
jgi:drug/metabolite transporter (DMT)-like permease